MPRVCVPAFAAFLLAAAASNAQPSRPASPQKTGEITGVVGYCGAQGSAGASVHIPGESSQARVAANGRFTLRFVPVGSYTLMVEIPGVPPHRIDGVAVSDNRVSDLGVVSVCRDNDLDGFTEDVDCNDNNPAVNPYATEACDGVDNNCDGTVDEGCAVCTDADGDGFYAQVACGTPVDCNDTNPLISPVATEVCDGIDNNCDGTVDELFDLSSDVSNCGSCGQACSFAGATAVCMSGACEVSACLPGFADCDAVASNGCEAALSSPDSCGACGVVCGEGATCAEGACVPAACGEGFADCDENLANGCETSVRTLTNCGSCGSVCSRANATATCSTGACALSSCNTGYANCDGWDANGCETSIFSLANCGSCGIVCSAANATATCSTGTCAIASCNAGYANCDGNQFNGCETSTRTLSNCGGCGVVCSLANATASCSTGTCAIASCNAGFSNCDGIASNGCETAGACP